LLGLAPHTVRLLYIQAFLTLKDTRTVMANTLCLNGLNIALNYALMWQFGAGGIALSTALCHVVGLMHLHHVFARRRS
jgi:peptidoglycan biosynthesis protein MviN/MurJ (putative lipid II flippase)